MNCSCNLQVPVEFNKDFDSSERTGQISCGEADAQVGKRDRAAYP